MTRTNAIAKCEVDQELDTFRLQRYAKKQSYTVKSLKSKWDNSNEVFIHVITNHDATKNIQYLESCYASLQELMTSKVSEIETSANELKESITKIQNQFTKLYENSGLDLKRSSESFENLHRLQPRTEKWISEAFSKCKDIMVTSGNTLQYLRLDKNEVKLSPIVSKIDSLVDDLHNYYDDK